MSIHFRGEVPKELKNRRILKAFISSMVKNFQKKGGSINFMFMDDESILVANKTYLSHDYYTDIITFDLSTLSDTIDADIMISYETVETNASKFQVSYTIELHRVIFHGILHLCGLNDKSTNDKLKMRETEDLYLQRYFELMLRLKQI